MDTQRQKKQYLFGIKVHMIVDGDGVPIEFSFTPGSASDIKSLEEFSFNLPEGSLLFGDAAYTNYTLEDLLEEVGKISLLPKRRKKLESRD